jgi:ectoine hydroxylase-related dioxygenase (phytanoyl-CoA dioxygenase family)
MVLMSQPIGPNVKYPTGEELEVQSGDLIMFPGYLKHSVRPNTTNRDRLILGFNIGCRGNYWSSQWTQND